MLMYAASVRTGLVTAILACNANRGVTHNTHTNEHQFYRLRCTRRFILLAFTRSISHVHITIARGLIDDGGKRVDLRRRCDI